MASLFSSSRLSPEGSKSRSSERSKELCPICYREPEERGDEEDKYFQHTHSTVAANGRKSNHRACKSCVSRLVGSNQHHTCIMCRGTGKWRSFKRPSSAATAVSSESDPLPPLSSFPQEAVSAFNEITRVGNTDEDRLHILHSLGSRPMLLLYRGRNEKSIVSHLAQLGDYKSLEFFARNYPDAWRKLINYTTTDRIGMSVMTPLANALLSFSESDPLRKRQRLMKVIKVLLDNGADIDIARTSSDYLWRAGHNEGIMTNAQAFEGSPVPEDSNALPHFSTYSHEAKAFAVGFNDGTASRSDENALHALQTFRGQRADLLVRNRFDKSILCFLAQKGYYRALEYFAGAFPDIWAKLINYKPDSPYEQSIPLCLVVQYQPPNMNSTIRVLVNNGADINLAAAHSFIADVRTAVAQAMEESGSRLGGGRKRHRGRKSRSKRRLARR